MPAADQGLGLVIAVAGRIEKLARRIAVHEDLAGDRAQAETLGLLEQRIDRLRVDRAMHGGGRDPVAQAFAQENLGHRTCKLRVGKALLGDEGVLVEPVEELQAARPDDLCLREVDMAVDEPGTDERVGAIVDHLGGGWQQPAHLGSRAEADDASLRHGDDRVRLVAQRRFDAAQEGVAAETSAPVRGSRP